ncbi:hypothetical protein F5883DRAFT_709606 [Diaporthe sp. PMI_573]|nr:hypothetical protein F5883DRAFT_709606 [Diaporthaceae sp. PMI_573]
MVVGSQKPTMTAIKLAEEYILRWINRPPVGGLPERRALHQQHGGLRGQLWIKILILEEIIPANKANQDGWVNRLGPFPPRVYDPWERTLAHSGSAVCGFQPSSFGIDLHPINFLQETSFAGDGTSPGNHLLSLTLTARRKLVWLVLLAIIVIPITSADAPIPYVDVAAWAFGTLANVPSIYALAIPPLSSSVDGRTEDTIWKIARGWSVSFGQFLHSCLYCC